jgi:hypothetical protein
LQLNLQLLWWRDDQGRLEQRIQSTQALREGSAALTAGQVVRHDAD